VTLGSGCLLPPLSSGGAQVPEPSLRFHTPLIEPDMRIARIRLSDRTSRLHPRRAASKLCEAYETDSLALQPCTRAPSPYFVTASPKASTVSLPPQLLRLHPAGAVAGWDFHPLESAAFARRTPIADARDRQKGVMKRLSERERRPTVAVRPIPDFGGPQRSCSKADTAIGQ
jgi:hypothetical protein